MVSSSRSLLEAGSPSQPLATTTLLPRLAATDAHLAPGGEPCPAPAGQPRGIHHVDEPPSRGGQRPVLPVVLGQVGRP